MYKDMKTNNLKLNYQETQYSYLFLTKSRIADPKLYFFLLSFSLFDELIIIQKRIII